MDSSNPVLPSVTFQCDTPCGLLYMIVMLKDEKPFEFIMFKGKGGWCASSQVESLARLLTYIVQLNGSIDRIIEELGSISCSQAPRSENGYTSCSDAIASLLKKAQEEKLI